MYIRYISIYIHVCGREIERASLHNITQQQIYLKWMELSSTEMTGGI